MSGPVDVSKPVENPELVARLLLRGGVVGVDEEARELVQMVRNATYLIASQVFHPDGGAPIVDGMMRAGTRINLFTVRLPDDRAALAVFTDWPSLRAATGDDQQWSGLVQAGEDLFRMGLQPDYPGGAVINPSGPKVKLAMEPERIAWMYENTTKPG